MPDERLYKCAFSGAMMYRPRMGSALLEEYGSAAAIFELPFAELVSRLGNDRALAERLAAEENLDWAREELAWCGEKGVEVLFKGDRNYPHLLEECMDAPLMLFYKGTADLNAGRSLSVVGTRMASGYGRECCSLLAEHVSPYRPLIVSGLAFGIDIAAHRAAMACGLDTVAVLPNGLDTIYPSRHREDAARMVSRGGVVTEFPRGTVPHKMNFIKRNRIIAGITQATVVAESRVKGGAMSTVEFANNYNRDVFAFPGRLTDGNSYGCNYLIAKNVAAIYSCAATVPSAMGWNRQDACEVGLQPQLFSSDIENKERILLTLNARKSMRMEEICRLSGLDWEKVSLLMLELELEGRISVSDGDEYLLIR